MFFLKNIIKVKLFLPIFAQKKAIPKVERLEFSINKAPASI